MKLNSVQRKRLAREARKLAGEFADGVAPKLDPYSYCGCAIGEIMLRGIGAKPSAASDDDPLWVEACNIDALLPDDPAFSNPGEGLVSAGLRKELAIFEPVPGAVVFPLLALADALEGK